MTVEISGDQLCRFRGDTAPDLINVTDANGAALDVTGFTYTLTINSEKRPSDTIQQLAQIAGVISDGPGGVVEFRWTAMDADIAIGNYWYDIEQVDAGGKVLTIAKNVYKIFQDITKVN